MDAAFYTLDKRRDSTKQPSGTGTVISVTLKEGSDFDYPVFLMQTNVTAFNYMKWNDHYYYITGRRFIHANLFEISCEIDALASCRGSIKSSSQYVLRTSVETLANYNLIDNSYATEAEPELWHDRKTIGMTDAGSYILVTKGGNGINYYGITESQLNSLLSSLLATKQENLWDTISNIGQTLGPSFLNVMEYIVGCRWMPFPIPSGGVSQNIYLGYWDSGISGKVYTTQLNLVSNPGGAYSLTVHPETDAKKAFMNCSQYHQCKVYVPGCGEIPIDFAKVNGSSINVSISVDVSGAVTAIIKNNDGEILATNYGVLGADVPISGSGFNLGGIISAGSGAGTVVSAIATAATGGFGAALGEAAAGAIEIGTGIAAAIPDVNTKGGAGSYYIVDDLELLGVTEAVYKLTAQAPTQQGYPSMKIATLSSNGYYQIKNPQVDFGDDLTIKGLIENYMRIGFYIE